MLSCCMKERKKKEKILRSRSKWAPCCNREYSIKVGEFSTGEQFYELCGGMMLPHLFLLWMCLFTPLWKGTGDSSFRVFVKMSFSFFTQHGDLTGKPHTDKKILILDIMGGFFCCLFWFLGMFLPITIKSVTQMKKIFIPHLLSGSLLTLWVWPEGRLKQETKKTHPWDMDYF